MQQFRAFLFGQLKHRDTGGHCQDFRNRVLINSADPVAFSRLPVGLQLGAFFTKLLFFITQARGFFKVLGINRGFFIAAHLIDFVIHFPNLGGCSHAVNPQARPGLVNQIDRLIGQVAIRNIAVGQRGRRPNRVIGNHYPVVCLVTIPQTGQNLYGIFHAGLFYLHRLETPLQGRIFFNIFTVFLGGGSPDGLQFPARQHRFEDRGRVNRALGGTCPHQGVNLVNE